MDWAVEAHYSPVHWNLLGIVLGRAGCAVTEANSAGVEAKSCTQERTHCEGQDRWGNVENNHRQDG